ncbi:MAG: response regulator transcription factor [Roseburia sp.]|nr:response regulator transcription factor [Roseburia sp.]
MNIGICDDQKEYRMELISFCEQYFKDKTTEYKIYEYCSGEEFAASSTDKLDILLLDIELDEGNGITIKDSLQRQKQGTKILFVSSHEEMLSEAFGREVYGFLGKPVQYGKFAAKMDAMTQDITDQGRFVVIEENGGMEKVYVQDIFYIKAHGKYTEIYVRDDREYLFSSKSIQEWAEELQMFGFGQCHRSYLVNYFNIRKFQDEILLHNGTRIPVSRRKRNEIEAEYKKFVWGRAR